MNLVEAWFGIVEGRAIRRGVLKSVKDLNVKLSRPTTRGSGLIISDMSLRRTLARTATLIAVTFTSIAAPPLSPGAQATASSGSCTTVGSTYEVCLTDGQARSEVLYESAASRIDSAPAGSTIRIALYTWNWSAYPTFNNAVTNAKDRGVDIKVILGSNIEKNQDTYAALTAALGSGNVRHCADNACISRPTGNAGLMHAKFITIQTATSTQVITLSANVVAGQFKRAQNSLTVTGDEDLYGSYVNFWNQMWGKQWSWTNSNMGHDGSGDGRKAYFFPRSSGDPLSSVINGKDCSSTGEQIRVLASQEIRPKLLKALQNAKRRGCLIRITVSSPEARQAILSSNNNNINDMQIFVNTSNHNKVVYIREVKADGNLSEVVFTGSHNANDNNLRKANDVMLRVRNAEVSALYRSYVLSLQ